jgi:hypothetical protein
MIFKLINYLFNRTELLKTLGIPRSSQWRRARAEFLKNNPCCAVCGSKNNVVPHHKIPFHADPELELDFNNLIPLCENKSFNCHFFFGHLRNWVGSNPFIEQDAAYWNKRLSEKNIDFLR